MEVEVVHICEENENFEKSSISVLFVGFLTMNGTMSSSNPCEPKFSWAVSCVEPNKVGDMSPKEPLAWAS